MQIQFRNFLSFKAISLDIDETRRTEDLLYSLDVPTKKEQAKSELFDIFDKHIQNEAKVKSGWLYRQDDFLQRLYLKFLESLENIKPLTIDKLLDILNSTKPNQDEIYEEYRFGIISINKQRNNYDDRTIETKLSEDKIRKPISTASQEERAEKLKKIRNLAESLQAKEKELLIRRASGKTYDEIANDEQVSNTNIRLKIKSAITKIQLNNNQLPVEYELYAEKFTKTFALSLNKQEVINFIINNIELLDYDIDNLNNNIKTTSKLLGINKKLLIQAGLNQASIFYQKPKTISNNVEEASKLLEINRKLFVNAALKRPPLFVLDPKTIAKKVDTTSEMLEVDRKLFIAAALKQPSLFYINTETILGNVAAGSNLLEVDKNLLISAGLKCPALFVLNPKSVVKKIDTVSAIFEVDRKLLINTYLKEPTLFSRKPETLFNNIDKASKLLGIDRKELINLALKHPSMLYQCPEKIAKKVGIIKYYKQIQGKNINRIAYSTNANEQLYHNILAYLIKEQDALPHLLKNNDVISHLKLQNKVYNFIIPENELSEEFIKYVQDFSISNLGKQIFDITIKPYE